MSLKEKIKSELNSAMKEKETLKVSVLRMVMAAVLNKEKEKKEELNDQEIIDVISSEIKKRKDSIEQYQKGGREDLADQENNELKILMGYMPEQMPEDEIRKLVKDKIKELSIDGPNEAGKVMGSLMPLIKGKADGSLVNKIALEELKNL